MRTSPYDPSAKKRIVRHRLKGDVYAKAKTHGNASQAAAAALAEALALRLATQLETEIEQDLAASNAHVEKNGSAAEMLREHLAERDDAACGLPQSDRERDMMGMPPGAWKLGAG